MVIGRGFDFDVESLKKLIKRYFFGKFGIFLTVFSTCGMWWVFEVWDISVRLLECVWECFGMLLRMLLEMSFFV